MNRSRKRTSPIVLAVGALILGTAPVQAADNGTVGVTITVASPCITVQGSFDFGTQAFSQPDNTTLVTVSGTASAMNCSGTTATFLARGSDAIAATDPSVIWSLGDNVCLAPNTYRINFTDFDPVSTSVILSNTDQTFLTGVADDGIARSLRGILSMPCAGSDGAGLVMSSTITLTATF
jgi:hypothetical protein